MTRYSRQERHDQITRLRAQGLTHKQVAAEIGMTRGGVRNVLNDPDGSKQQARRARYQGTCEVCGQLTDGSSGRANAPKRCAAHIDYDAIVAARGQKRWSRERIIEAAQEFDRRYGRPPASGDWEPAMARSRRRLDRVAAFYADGCWPHVHTVTLYFGGWNRMLEEAGLPTRAWHAGHEWTPEARARQSVSMRAYHEKRRAAS